MNIRKSIALIVLALVAIACGAMMAYAGQGAPAKNGAQTKSGAAASPATVKPKTVKITPVAVEAPLPIQVIPQPVSVSPGKGVFVFTAHTQIVAAASRQALAEQLRDYLRPAMGFPLPIVRAGQGSGSHALR